MLDDYQGVALSLAHRSAVSARANVVVFNDHLADTDALVERLKPVDVVWVMRERTPLRCAVIERLPRLKLIASTRSRTPRTPPRLRPNSPGHSYWRAHGISLPRTNRFAPAVGDETDGAPDQYLARPIVVEAALIRAFDERQIAGAAIDVFDSEPLPPDHPYRHIDHLLATPHIGYVARGLYERVYGDTVANILARRDAQIDVLNLLRWR